MGLIQLWHRLIGRLNPPDRSIDDASWRGLLESSALFSRLDNNAASRLRELCGRFLSRKSFSAAGGHELDETQCLAIAALACLPLIRLDFDWLEGWSEVIVYPGGFRVRREHHDEHSGVVTEGDDELIGEAWERGPVILSWADIAEDLAHPFEGLNVVIHEIAHKFDMLDGAMNGVPRLPASIPRAEWIATLQTEYDGFVSAVEAGIETTIDPYAAESPDEFFAVVCEQYFSCRDVMWASMPATTLLFDRLFGGDPPTA